MTTFNTDFEPALWDGSDPLYAPYIAWRGSNPVKRYAYWKCPKRFLDAGYEVKRVNLDLPGLPDDQYQRARAEKCRRYTQELAKWCNDRPTIQPNTWQWLVERYRTDDFSPMQEVKGNTQKGYNEQLDRIAAVIGHMKIEALNFVEIKTLQKRMTDKGRSHSFIHRFFNTLRRVARYGKALGVKAAAEVADVLAEIRFPTGAKKQTAPTRDQVMSIVKAADEEGSPDIALGLLLQFELTMRAVDIRGQWLPCEADDSGIGRNGKRWQDCLTWDMVANDFSSITKTISKTERSMPEPITFDLTALPEVQTRLRLLAMRGRIGPVILSPRSGNLPYTRDGWRIAFARLWKEAGVPKHIKAMDLRAGAITEAKNSGVDGFALRDAAQHSSIETTNGYTRARESGIREVIQIRQNARKVSTVGTNQG